MIMKWNKNRFLLGLLIAALPSWASASPLARSALDTSGTAYLVQAGTYGDLIPEGDGAEAGGELLVLDVFRPGQESERLIVPTTLGPEVESSPVLLYSREGDALDVLWQSRLDDEVAVHLTRFDGTAFSPVEEVYFSPDGVVPKVAVTHDALHLEIGDDVVRAERHIVHLFWMQEVDGVGLAHYTPVLFLDGAFSGWKEVFSFPHLNTDPNQVAHARLPELLHVATNGDRDSVRLTFGSSASGKLTTYELEYLPMDVVYLSDLIRELALDADFDPGDISGFSGNMGAELIGVGLRARSRTHLTPEVLDFVATGLSERILETGADYGASDAEALAEDLRQHTLERLSGLFAPAAVAAKSSGSLIEIDAGGLLGDEPGPAPNHILDLRVALERPVPEAGGRKLTVYTSDDGLELLAFWKDRGVLWYVESRLDEDTWSEPRPLRLGEGLSLADARELLRQRIR